MEYENNEQYIAETMDAWDILPQQLKSDVREVLLKMARRLDELEQQERRT